MSLDTIGCIAQRLLEDGLLGPCVTVVWHAGEPLVAPPAYYASAFSLLDKMLGRQCSVSHAIQTNATLINDAWCALFKDHQVRVGVSVDGPAPVHDQHRKTRQGQGTHAQVLRGIEKLRRHGVPFHAIAVVTADALGLADELYDFFSSQEIYDVGFNFDEVEGAYACSSLQGQDAAHKAFLERTLEHSITAGGRYQIRELASALRLIAQGLPQYTWRGEPWPENAQTIPFRIITVGWNGDFSTFSPELLGQSSAEFEHFVLGNVVRSGFLQAATTPGFLKMWHLIREGTAVCRQTCAYFQYCGGGAPVNKLYENGSFASAETLYCRIMFKRPFDVVLERLERENVPASETAP
jgi:uncharacterized protein